MADQDPNVPMTPSALPTPSNTTQTPTAPTAPNATAQPNPASAASAPATPQQLHTSIFNNILGTLAGGSMRPVRDAQGNPVVNPDGTPQMAPASKKALGASILAGALSAMVAGYAAPTSRTPIAGNRSVQDFGPSVAAGAAASQPFTQAGSKSAAQKEADDIRTSQYANLKHNLELHALMIANDKADMENQQNMVDDWDSVNQTLGDSSQVFVDKDGNAIDNVMSYQDIDAAKLHELMANKTLGITKDTIAPSKVVMMPDDKGEMHPTTLFNVYNPAAMIKMTDALREDNPNLVHVANGTSVPIRVLAQNALDRSQENLAASGIKDQLAEYDKANGTHLADTFNLKNATKKNALIKSVYPYMNKYRTDDLDLMMKDLEKDPKAGPGVAALAQQMGITPEGLVKMAQKRTEDLKQAEKGPDAAPAPLEQIDNIKKNIAVLHPHLSPAQQDVVKSLFYQGMTNAAFKKATDDADSMEKNNIAANQQREKLSDQEVKDLLNEGRTGTTTLDVKNAAPEMLVDQRTGLPVPYKLQNSYAPTQQEKNRKAFATTVLDTINTLQAMQAAGKLPNGPVTGLTTQALAAAGMSTENAQQAITTIGLMQTAATGAHVAGRFSVPVLDKMSKLIKLNMNDDQFQGALDGLKPIMQNYADKGGGITVSEWRDMSEKDRKEMVDHAHDTSTWWGHQGTAPAAKNTVPPSKWAVKDAKGNVIGYSDDNKGTNYVPFNKG